MMFFTGIHQPCDAGCIPAAFVSMHRLETRKKSFPARRVVIDSGAFQTINLHGGYPEPPEVYAAQLKRWKHILGRRLLAAVSQDWMCEPYMLARTGLMVHDHQRLTIERYDKLIKANTGVRIIPVLQGWKPSDYVQHLKMYGPRIKRRMWVGVGTLCKRQGSPALIEDILLEIKLYRPDLRLHGFGVKITSLESDIVRNLLWSADSMAWSYAARRQGRNRNNRREAQRYHSRVMEHQVQLSLFWPLIKEQLAELPFEEAA